MPFFEGRISRWQMDFCCFFFFFFLFNIYLISSLILFVEYAVTFICAMTHRSTFLVIRFGSHNLSSTVHVVN